ncbi:hypothetical protein GOODEAATRI_020499 [Goodea atripinnis]|uniref:Uncharacterized protein n=1 Tax=Goodea atripinnis TaxID=208336 RepID=A0ABV0P6H0_9TELE
MLSMLFSSLHKFAFRFRSGYLDVHGRRLILCLGEEVFFLLIWSYLDNYSVGRPNDETFFFDKGHWILYFKESVMHCTLTRTPGLLEERQAHSIADPFNYC